MVLVSTMILLITRPPRIEEAEAQKRLRAA